MGSFFQSYPVSAPFRERRSISLPEQKPGSPAWLPRSRHHCLLFFDPFHRIHSQSGAFRPGDQRVMLLFNRAGLFSLEKEPSRRYCRIHRVRLALLTSRTMRSSSGLSCPGAVLWKTITADRSDHQGPELNMFLNADVYRKPSCPQILELRPDNCIFFGNANTR